MDSQGKGKKRSVGWFPASYVKLLESRKEEDSAAGPAQAVASGEVFYILKKSANNMSLLVVQLLVNVL